MLSLIQTVVRQQLDVASTLDPNDPTQPSNELYDEFNAPLSADWVIVLRWILDRLFLDGLPAYYLLPDASHLPQESLKVFTIDDNRMSFFLDRALSVGNQLTKKAIKLGMQLKCSMRSRNRDRSTLVLLALSNSGSGGGGGGNPCLALLIYRALPGAFSFPLSLLHC